MRTYSKPLFLLLMALLSVAVLSACASGETSSTEEEKPEGNEEETAEAEYPVEVTNYTKPSDGAEWSEKTQTFEDAPESVVANSQGAAELMIQLGLTDHIKGVAAIYGEGDPEVKEEFNEIPVISEEYASKEMVVGEDPDLVFGRGGLFANTDWGVGTVDALNDLGIATYVQNTSVPGATLDSLYKDIEEIGKIFNVEERASEYTETLQSRADALKEESADRESLTYAYVSDDGEGNVSVYSGSTDTYTADVLGLLGLENAFGDVEGEISRETLIETNPDILLLSEYAGGVDVEKTMEAFYADETLQSMKAIQDKQIYPIDFNQFWGYSYTILDGAEKLAKELDEQ